MSRFVDLTGQKFGRLTVVRRLSNNKYNFAMWQCKCNCGNIKNVSTNSLKSGNTQSCGCLQKEKVKEIGYNNNKNKIPIKIRNTLYRMRTRCYNPKSSQYKYYGARGISICEQWMDKENGMLFFYKWAIQNGYKEGLTIDRIDVNGNYEPNNCRWATIQQQANNKRNTRYLIYNNEKHTIFEWAKITNIPLKTIRNRVNKGNDIHKIFNKHIGNEKSVVQYDLKGKLIKKYKSIKEAKSQTGILGISNCCNGYAKTAGKYIWKYDI